MDEKIVKCDRCGLDKFRNETEVITTIWTCTRICRACIAELSEIKNAKHQEACGWVK
jgi:hypothetical protein